MARMRIPEAESLAKGKLRMMSAFSQGLNMRKSPPRSASKKAEKKNVASDKNAIDDRHRRVAALAYTLGARRGFEGSSDEAREDWLQAEREIDESDGKAS